MTQQRYEQSRRGAWKRQNAAEMRVFARHPPRGTKAESVEKAVRADEVADALLTLNVDDPTLLTDGGGGELRLTLREVRPYMNDHGEPPDLIAADASRIRLELADTTGYLPLAVDTAESVGASDGVQQMLAHQIAAGHASGMRLLELGQKAFEIHQVEGLRSPYMGVEAARILGLAARLFEMTHRSALAINRLKTAGKQTLVVQHVHVADGGQAVVAGAVGRRMPPKGRRDGGTAKDATKHPMQQVG